MFRTLRFYHSFFKFLSTPSSRRATGAARHHATVPTYFYPRPPRGGRRFIWLNGIKIDKFLSTPSARRATVLFPDAFRHYPISIHALREEGDLLRYWLSLSIWLFLSTPSARRATLPRASRAAGRGISIHALREEGDGWAHLAGIKAEISIHALREEGDKDYFTSCLPSPLFLSTPSARRATQRLLPTSQSSCHFYPRPPRGGRQHDQRKAV